MPQILLAVLFYFINRVNPIREGDSEMEVEDISRLLHKHVTNMYPSIKEAFLAFDQVRQDSEFRKNIDLSTGLVPQNFYLPYLKLGFELPLATRQTRWSGGKTSALK